MKSSARWHQRWLARLKRQPQPLRQSDELRRAHNPAFIPRNHLVEAALSAAEQNDLSVMERLLDVLANPYDHDRPAPEYRRPLQQAARATRRSAELSFWRLRRVRPGESSPNRAVSHRVSRRIHVRDTVLPFSANGAAQQIGGAWFQDDGNTLPLFIAFSTQTEAAGRKQRDTDYVAEDSFVAVPADARVRAVFGDQHLRQLFSRQLRESRGLCRSARRKAGMSSAGRSFSSAKS